MKFRILEKSRNGSIVYTPQYRFLFLWWSFRNIYSVPIETSFKHAETIVRKYKKDWEHKSKIWKIKD